MIRPILLAVAAALSLPGCCTIAHYFCPCDPGVVSKAAGVRETPDDAVDFLIAAFRDRRVADIYDTFHPEFIRENGDFTKEEFKLAYDKFVNDFTADANSLATAERVWLPPQKVEKWGELSAVHLANAGNGAAVKILFQNHPKIRIVTSDPYVGMIEGPVDKDALIRLENGHLGLPADFDLTSIENVQHDTVKDLKASDIVRVEISNDWQVRRVPQATAKNIRFLDKLKEYTGK